MEWPYFISNVLYALYLVIDFLFYPKDNITQTKILAFSKL